MIEVFYNLKQLPFQKSICQENLFLSSSAKELSQRLEYMKQKRGIMLITGMPGTGKTLHIRSFVEKLNSNLYKSFYFPLSTVTTLEFYSQLSLALCGETFFRKSQLFAAIQNSIKDYVANQKKIPIIIFDEAHLIKNENFQELQIISNFNMDSADPALFIIAGQPHLWDRLLRPIHLSFNQRISMRFYLPPMTKNETQDYIIHQLNIAGTDKAIFNPNAIHTIYQNSGGVPRMINTIALKTMTLGALEKMDSLSEEEVYRASQEL
jgi:type II secretory pathway predicted ATPase ExeA